MTPSLTLSLRYVILLANWVLLETPKRRGILCNTRGSITIKLSDERDDMYSFAYTFVAKICFRNNPDMIFLLKQLALV